MKFRAEKFHQMDNLLKIWKMMLEINVLLKLFAVEKLMKHKVVFYVVRVQSSCLLIRSFVTLRRIVE